MTSDSTRDAPARVLLEVAGHAPWHSAAREAFAALVEQGWADPRRLSAEGRRARLLLEAARESLAAGLGARTEEIHLTGSHTQSLHAAVRAVVRGRRRTGTTVLASAVERTAVLAAARFAGELESVDVDGVGRVDADTMARRLAAPGIALVALQHANGEVGTLQPLDAVGEAARAAGVPLLVDAGASIGHVAPPATWDEVREAAFSALDERVRISGKELEMSAALVESFAGDFDPSRFNDDYQEQLRELIEAKLKKGDALDTDATFGMEDEEKEGAEVIDLMEALRRSVEKSRGGKAKKRAAPKKGSAPKKEAGTKQAAKRTPAKGTTARKTARKKTA